MAQSLSSVAMVPAATASLLAFVIIVLAVAAAFIGAVRWSIDSEPQRSRATALAAMVTAAWLAITSALARTGVIASFAGSAALVAYLVLCNGIAVVIALSPVGRGFAAYLPVATLVGFHAFRLPLELVLHRWYEQGVVPVQMTWSGQNLDIITGILAVILASMLASGRLAKRFVLLGYIVLFRWLLAGTRRDDTVFAHGTPSPAA